MRGKRKRTGRKARALVAALAVSAIALAVFASAAQALPASHSNRLSTGALTNAGTGGLPAETVSTS